MNTPALTLAAALAATAFAASALAGERYTKVAYDDPNLATPDGRAELQGRLDRAARSVCRFNSDGQLATADQENACYRLTRKQVEVRFAQAVAEDQRGTEPGWLQCPRAPSQEGASAFTSAGPAPRALAPGHRLHFA